MACKKDKEVDDPNITYVKLDSVLTQVNTSYNIKKIDFNNDGINDFRMYTDIDSSGTKATLYSAIYSENANQAILAKKINGDFFLTGSASDRYFLTPKSSGDLINATQSVWISNQYCFSQIFTKNGVTTSDQAGDFAGKGDKFIGVRFKDAASANHYGWLRINLSADGKTLKVIDGAYHVTPDAEIKIGAK